jgi:SWI/SNF-related matrix-associated actin-dependent regulator of chromatin subfamily A3
MARAICSLNSVSRWAVTGTPIQNKLADLTTLLNFLNVYPYSDKRAFDADISDLWKSGQVDEAVKRLKRLSVCLLLRRPKQTLQLPPKNDMKLTIRLDPAERQLYDEIRHHVIDHIDSALHHRGDSHNTPAYVNVLQKIEAMRMVCNIGNLYPARHELSKNRAILEGEWHSTAQQVFNLQRGAGQVHCQHCLQTLDMEGNLGTDSIQPVESLFYRCLVFTCSTCSQGRTGDGRISCGHDPPCPMATVSTDPSLLEESSTINVDRLEPGLGAAHPTKVVALLEDLQRQPEDVKW